MIRVAFLMIAVVLERTRDRIRDPAFRSLLIGSLLLLLVVIEMIDNLIHYMLSLVKLFLLVVSSSMMGAVLLQWLLSLEGVWTELEAVRIGVEEVKHEDAERLKCGGLNSGL